MTREVWQGGVGGMFDWEGVGGMFDWEGVKGRE